MIAMPDKYEWGIRPGESGHDWLARIWDQMLDQSETRMGEAIKAATEQARGPPDEPTEDEPTDKPP